MQSHHVTLAIGVIATSAASIADAAGNPSGRVMGLVVDDPAPREGAPSLARAAVRSGANSLELDVARAGPHTIDPRPLVSSELEVRVRFDQPVIAVRRGLVEGANLAELVHTPGDTLVTLRLDQVEDGTPIAVGLVDVLGGGGVNPYAEVRLGVLAGDFSQDGVVDPGDILAFIDAFHDGNPAIDLDQNGRFDIDDLDEFARTLDTASATITDAPPTISIDGPLFADPAGRPGRADVLLRDDFTPTSELDVSITSSDPSVVDPAGVELLELDGGHVLRVTPETGDGTARVTIRVSDGVHASESYAVVNVGAATAPSAIMDSDTYMGVAPLTVTFDASESFDAEHDIARYRWDFGGDGGAEGLRAAHTFTRPGQYTVRLETRDRSRLSDETTRVITVVESPYDPAAPVTEAEARRFLWQAAWGPGQEDVDFVMNFGFEAWIDQQIALPPSYLSEELTDQLDQLDGRWANAAEIWESYCVQGPDQLRQRLAWALVQIIAIRPGGFREEVYNTYIRHALGDPAMNASGNYRELLHEITYNAEMGEWLTYVYNRKADPVVGTKPDENYAREIMQLFTIGLWQLQRDGQRVQDVYGDPIPTYDPEFHVAQFARIFTGLWWDWPSHVMRVEPYFHEFGDKQLLDYPGAIPLDGYVPPAANDDEADVRLDIDLAIDNLFEHPSTPPFISELLIKRLVTSNPTPAYIDRVAEAFEGSGPFGSGIRGDLRAVTKAILLDDEARNPAYRASPYYGKPKEPVVMLLGGARALGMAQYRDVPYPFQSAFGLCCSWIGDQLGQRWLGTPSVFNFYQPDYAPLNTDISAAGLSAPELQILNDRTAVAMISRFGRDIAEDQDEWDPAVLAELIALTGTPAALVDRLDLMLNGGATSNETKAIIANAVGQITREEWRLGAAVQLLMASPDFRVLR